MACLLLAAKTEESPKKLTNVIQECHRLKNRAAAQARAAGRSPGSTGGLTPSPAHGGGLTPTPGSTPSSGGGGRGSGGGGGGGGRDDREGLLDTKSEEFVRLKERILLLERVILHTIGFELDIHHPYKFLVEQIKKLNHNRMLEYEKPPPGGGAGSSAKMTQELVQYGMNFANDSLHTTLCLQFPARSVACACTYLACRVCKIRPVGGREWPDVLGVDPEALACKFCSCHGRRDCTLRTLLCISCGSCSTHVLNYYCRPDVCTHLPALLSPSPILTAISVQLMELIADKKGCDLAVFKNIRADLDSMGSESGEAVGQGDAKRPKLR